MFTIEFLKILKRKFNYVYFLVILCLCSALSYKYEIFTNYLDVQSSTYIYEYLLKGLLLLTVVILTVNLVFSYREDYTTNVNNIIVYSRISKFNNLFSKFFVNTFLFCIFYIINSVIVIGYFYYKKIILLADLQNTNTLLYFALSLSMIAFSASIVLLALSIFNNTNLALSLVLLFFVGTKFLSGYLRGLNDVFKYIEYSFVDIFNASLGHLSVATAKNNFIFSIIYLLANALALFVISLLLKVVKNK